MVLIKGRVLVGGGGRVRQRQGSRQSNSLAKSLEEEKRRACSGNKEKIPGEMNKVRCPSSEH